MAKLITVTVEFTIKVESQDDSSAECAEARFFVHELLSDRLDGNDTLREFEVTGAEVYDDLDPKPEPMPPEYFTDDRDE